MTLDICGRARLGLALMLLVPLAHAASDAEDAKLERARAVLTELLADTGSGLSRNVLARAQGVAIIPDTFRGGLLLGGQRGHGVLSVRTDGGGWSNPSFVTLTAGSIGWQIGAESIDIVLVFANRASIARIEHGQFSLSGDITAVAGPEGTHTRAPLNLNREVYAYVAGSGLFAGAAFEGARLGIDRAANARYYAQGAKPLGAASPTLPASARQLLELLQQDASPGSGATTEEATIYPLKR